VHPYSMAFAEPGRGRIGGIFMDEKCHPSTLGLQSTSPNYL